jgi:membrane-associated phospholipid phosphatase
MAIGIGIWWLTMLALGDFKPDHLIVGVILLTCRYASPKLRPAFDFLLPLGLTAIVYDGRRYFAGALRGEIHVSQPYLFDRTWFGIPFEGRMLTPNEWWQLHTHWTLDLLTGVFYLTFLALFIATAAYFRFALKLRRGTQLAWGFLWVNLVGYATYAIYPAAPPWYAALHGLGPADPLTAPFAAGCLRFDGLVGMPLFAGMYAKSTEVFGAIPSLHVAYPMLVVWFAFRFKKARIWSAVFFGMMAFSAVYTNHHYILDVLVGSAYGLLVGWGLDVYEVWNTKAPVPSPSPREPLTLNT